MMKFNKEAAKTHFLYRGRDIVHNGALDVYGDVQGQYCLHFTWGQLGYEEELSADMDTPFKLQETQIIQGGLEDHITAHIFDLRYGDIRTIIKEVSDMLVRVLCYFVLFFHEQN